MIHLLYNGVYDETSRVCLPAYDRAWEEWGSRALLQVCLYQPSVAHDTGVSRANLNWTEGLWMQLKDTYSSLAF